MTTTAAKPKAKKPAPQSATIPAVGGTEENRRGPDLHTAIEVARLVPSPTNPRKHFDPEAIKTLSVSIQNLGLIQPIIVRQQFAGSFEIIAGERRYRAAKLAGLEKINCVIRNLTDAEVIEVQLIENLEREDLNPIEEAESFLGLTTNGGYSQRDLAKRLGCSQAHIANRIRLLDLPELWRKRLISQEIAPTHARCLLSWAKRPQILEEVERRVIRDFGTGDKFPSPEELTVEDLEETISSAAMAMSRPMRKSQYTGQPHACHFRPSETDEKDLEIEELHGSQRAFNVELYDRLQKEALKRSKERKKHEEKKKDSVSASAAKKKASEELDQKLRGYVAGLRQKAIIESIDAADSGLVILINIYFVASGDLMEDEDLREYLVEAGGRVITEQIRNEWSNRMDSRIQVMGSLLTVPAEKTTAFCKSVAKYQATKMDTEWVRGQNDLRSLFNGLGLKLTESWKLDQDFLDIYPSNGDLIEMAIKELGLKTTRSTLEEMTREQLVTHVLDKCSKAKFPKSLSSL